MWTILLVVGVTLLVAGVLLWSIWPARTGAVASGEPGNHGLIPSSGGYGDAATGPGDAGDGGGG